jgi:hypothetical protein
MASEGSKVVFRDAIAEAAEARRVLGALDSRGSLCTSAASGL